VLYDFLFQFRAGSPERPVRRRDPADGREQQTPVHQTHGDHAQRLVFTAAEEGDQVRIGEVYLRRVLGFAKMAEE